MPGNFHIGTSNIVLPVSKQNFPEDHRDKSRLHYYSTIFNSLEINSSFYKLPQARTFARWATEVKQPFTFSVKLWKGITHVKELKFSKADILCFMSAANALGNAKGCLLIQFPAGVRSEYSDQLNSLLSIITTSGIKHDWKIAVELRHISWYTSATYHMLDTHGASLVMHDIPASKMDVLKTKSSAAFMRFHGEKGDYRGSYSEARLEEAALMIKGLLKKDIDVYAYFNNTIGAAFDNAVTLQRLVSSK